MRLLLDTHVLLWAAADSDRLTDDARGLIEDRANEKVFSAASLWEIAIKLGLGRSDFQLDPAELRRGLLEHGYRELPVTGAHAIFVMNLAPLHKDPFDRILIAQAVMEGLTLLTADSAVMRYGGPTRKV